MSVVEIWLLRKAKLSWSLRSNTEIGRFLGCRKAVFSEADFFNRIGQKQPFAQGSYRPVATFGSGKTNPSPKAGGGSGLSKLFKEEYACCHLSVRTR